jgi:hypothetical protein
MVGGKVDILLFSSPHIRTKQLDNHKEHKEIHSGRSLKAAS